MAFANVYTLEVVKFLVEKDGPDGWLARRTKHWHVGYMDAVFKTKEDACSYYDRHNPHMRSLNAHKTWQSDWDPNTHLLYIVRKFYGIGPTVPPFSPKDASIISNGGHTRESKFVK